MSSFFHSLRVRRECGDDELCEILMEFVSGNGEEVDRGMLLFDLCRIKIAADQYPVKRKRSESVERGHTVIEHL